MRSKLLYGLALSPCFLYAQEGAIKSLNGKAVSETEVANVRVINASMNVESNVGTNGEFRINARQTDTLIFTGMAIETKILRLRSEQFERGMIEVILEPYINMIEEVVIPQYVLTGNLSADSRNIKVKDSMKFELNFGDISKMDFADDNKSAPKYNVMPVIESSLTGIDFIYIGSRIAKMILGQRKSEKKIVAFDFITATRSKLPHDFFIQTLKLKENQLDSFLQYCEARLKEDPEMLKSHNELALMEFLIARREDFTTQD